MKKANKLILIGLDCILYYFVERFSNEGVMPFTAKLIENGVFGEALPSPPCDTPTNWTTIVTGAWTGTHGMTSFYAHIPGKPLNEGVGTLNSQVCKAEFLWNVAEREGKFCVIINYPVAWPPTIKRGVVIGGPSPGAAPWRVAWATCFTNENLPQAIKVSFVKAENWKNLPESYSPPMETAIVVGGEGELVYTAPGWQISKGVKVKSPIYYILAIDSKGKGYDTIYICKEKDVSKAITTLKEGQWSNWIYEVFQDKKVVFKFKLLRLSTDLKSFRLYRTDVFEVSGWSYPKEVASEVLSNIGPYIEGFEHSRGYSIWYDENVWLEHIEQQVNWFINTAGYLKKKYNWDILIFHFHLHDAINHSLLGYLCEEFPDYDKKKALEIMEFFKKCYKETDRLIKGIIEECADNDTLVLVISDHGCIPAWKFVWIGGVLIRRGLLTYKWDDEKKCYIIDWTKTKAYPFGHTTPYIWVNLKGRDPHGIVEPSEYEEVREEIIDALYSIRDPETGERVMALVARKEDLATIGQLGDRVGDVVYFLKPGYANVCFDFSRISPKIMEGRDVRPLKEMGPWTALHHDYLPTAKLGPFKVSSTFILYGPGVRRGLKLEKPVNLVDITPTICYLLGLPMPRNCEGRILWEILED